MDEILLIGDTMSLIQSLILYLNKNFDLKDLRDLNYILILQASCMVMFFISLNQSIFMTCWFKKKMVLNHYQALIIASKQLSIHDGDHKSDPHTYCSTINALQYLTLIKPNVTFEVNKACQFICNSTTLHWK